MPIRKFTNGRFSVKRFTAPGAGSSASFPPTWVTANGSLGIVSRNSAFTPATVTAISSGSIIYAVSSGTLPEGLYLGSSNGTIFGTYSLAPKPNTGNSLIKNFNVRATDTSSGLFSDASFSINTINEFVTTVNFSYTGADQLYTLPPNVNWVRAQLWGAGGGNWRATTGAGGYTEAIVSVPSGVNTMNVIVGGAGGNYNGGYGGGGFSNVDGGSGGGGGGGRSAIRFASPGNPFVEVLTAGGGGGSGLGGNSGGGGGGLTGLPGNGPAAGTGGTQSTGGAGGTGSGGTAGSGSQFQGGTSTGGFSGGGGGGGYYGGGGASGVPTQHHGGGGGSGFIGTNGSTALPGNEQGSFSTFGDTTPRFDSVRAVYYEYTRCLRGGTANSAAAYSGPGYSPGTGGSGQNGYVSVSW
jgi:hypothetical protein